MCSWHFSAVWLRYGSIAISFAPAPLRLLHARPQVQVGDDRVAAPDQDQTAVLELLDVGAHRGADRRDPSRLAGRRTDRPVEQRRAEAMKEAPIHRAVLQQAHRSGVRVRQDGLRTVGRGGDRAESCRDRPERLVPGDALEAAGPLRADAAHRMQHALVRVRAVEVAGDLGAERAGGRRMIGCTADLDRASAFHGDLQSRTCPDSRGDRRRARWCAGHWSREACASIGDPRPTLSSRPGASPNSGPSGGVTRRFRYARPHDRPRAATDFRWCRFRMAHACRPWVWAPGRWASGRSARRRRSRRSPSASTSA